MTHEQIHALATEAKQRVQAHLNERLADDETLNDLPLSERLFIAQKYMPDVPKLGQAPQKIGGFDYLQDEHLLPVAKATLHALNIRLTYEYNGHEREDRHVHIYWTFTYHTKDGKETETHEWMSEGKDGSDKATSKAVTQARKDFLRSQLKVPGGAENEADPTSYDNEEPTDSGFQRASDEKVTVIVKGTEPDDKQIQDDLKTMGFGWKGDAWKAENIAASTATSKKTTLEDKYPKLTVEIQR